MSSSVPLMFILCLFVWHCYCFVLHLLDTSFLNLVFFSHSSCVISSCIVAPYTLSLLSHCCSSRVVVLHATPLVLLFSCYNCGLFFLRYSSSPDAAPLTLLLLLHCFSHLATPFMSPPPLHYSPRTIAHFRYLLT